MKVTFDADVVIVGWTEGEGSRAGSLGSLMMAVYDDGELRYVGNVGTGFGRGLLQEVFDSLNALPESGPPFSSEVLRSRPELRQAHWVPPSLVAMVEHRGLDLGRPSPGTFVQRFPGGQGARGVHLRSVVARLTTTGILGRCRAITTTPATVGRISWATSLSVGFRQQSAPGWCWPWSTLCSASP